MFFSMAHANELESVLDKMLKRTIPVIKTETLVSKLEGQSDVLLLDSREKPEFDLSHLPKAKWVGYDDFSIDRVSGIPKDRTIVVYCSIGVRSEKVAEKLKQAGFTDVHNLYGGIFDWANKSRHLVDVDELPTKTVHGYSSKWAKLLAEHVDTPQGK